MKVVRHYSMQLLAAAVLIAANAGWGLAQAPATEKPKKPVVVKGREIVFDTDVLPTDASLNPYSILASLNCWTQPVLDHTGKPHHNGHLVQVVVDGGNGIQDLPNPDGSPGGDDSLAYGNFNMMRLTGLDVEPDLSASSGMFFSKKYLVPFVPPPRAYYLRLWEGDDVATAPYYQDTIEYSTDGGDHGGGMITLRSASHPMDVDWTFGPSKVRTKARPDPKK
jgi:hypothetical protein